jgi:hypothetical protein
MSEDYINYNYKMPVNKGKINMKNIHVIPTDEPSRLWFNDLIDSNELILSLTEVESVNTGAVIVGVEPNEVRLDEVTPEARVDPVKVPAAAVMVPVPPSDIDVPLIVREEFVSATVGVAPSPLLFVRVIPVPATSEAT